MEEVSVRRKGTLTSNQVTSRTTHIVLPDKLSKEQLIQKFRTEGYLLPITVTKKTLYRAALGRSHGIPMYIPLVKDVVAPHYQINKHIYLIKPEIAAVGEFANMPGEAVAAIVEEVTFNIKGMPLWCEGSRVDIHYYLMLLQYLDPRIYNSIKSSTEVMQHVLLLDADAKTYLAVQSKIGKQLLDLQTHAVKLRSMKNKASGQMKALLETGSFCKAQLLNFVQLNGGMDVLGKEFLDSMAKLIDFINGLSSTNELKNAREYYEAFIKKNRSGLKQERFAIDIKEPCPPPLQDTEMPVEAFGELTNKMLGFLGQYELSTAPVNHLHASMPSYAYRLPRSESLVDNATVEKMGWLIKIAQGHVKKNSVIPISTLRLMLAEKIWRFDVATRSFVPNEGWEMAPTIPSQLCFNFASSEQGSKMIEAALHGDQVRVLNIADYFGKQTKIDDTFLRDGVRNELVSELVAPIIREAATEKEKMKLYRTVDKIVSRSIQGAVDSMQQDQNLIEDLLKQRRESVSQAFPGFERLQPTISQKLCELADVILRGDPMIAARLRQMDPENKAQVKILEVVGPAANKLAVSKEFITAIYKHANFSSAMIESKRNLASGELKLLYSNASNLIGDMLKFFGKGDTPNFIKAYDSLSSLGINNNYEPGSASVRTAVTSGANTAGASALMNGFISALDVDQQVAKLLSSLDRDDLNEVLKTICAIPAGEAPKVVQTCIEEMKKYYEKDIPTYAETLQPYSFAFMLLGRYLLDVCFELAVYLNSIKKKNKLKADAYEKASDSLRFIYRCTMLCKYQFLVRSNTELLPIDDLQKHIQGLAVLQLLEFKTHLANSIQINFRNYAPEQDYFKAFAMITALALRATGNKLGNRDYLPLVTSELSLLATTTTLEDNPNSYSHAFIAASIQDIIRSHAKLRYIVDRLEEFDMPSYLDSSEVTLALGSVEGPKVSVIKAKSSAKNRTSATLSSIFEQPTMIDKVRVSLNYIVTRSTFFKETSWFWKK